MLFTYLSEILKNDNLYIFRGQVYACYGGENKELLGGSLADIKLMESYGDEVIVKIKASENVLVYLRNNVQWFGTKKGAFEWLHLNK